MKEEEYIELQNLLIRLRVKQLKEYSNNKNDITERRKAIRNIRAIDLLRKNIELELKEDI